MTTTPLAEAAAGRIEELEALDGVAGAAGRAIRGAVPAGPVKDGLSGRWLGHALHPLLTDVPIGTWTSAALLDLLGGRQSEAAARRLIAIGLAATPATAVTGWADWADTEPASGAVRRAGLVHATLNGLGAAAMALSLKARREGRTGRGRLLSLAGLGAVGMGGWLGGHLSYARGVGVNTTALERDVDEWTPVMPESELRDGEPACAIVDGTAIVLVRQSGRIHALADRCAHRGGPLHEGDVGEGTITCPLHGSCFRLEDGGVVSGPSAHPQPAYDVRVGGGRVQVRARAPKSFVTAA